MQMAVMAGAYGAAMGYLWRIGAPRAVFWTALVLFALFPVHAMLAISDTKDGFFVALLVLVVIRFHRLLEDPSLMRRPGFVAGFAALGALKQPPDTVFVLGMGGETIGGILRRGHTRLGGAALILGAQTDLPMVRRTCLLYTSPSPRDS